MTDAATKHEPPTSVAILGAGTMGPGIALTFARAGTQVTLTTRRNSTLERCRRHLGESLELLVQHDLLDPPTAAATQARITTTLWGDADLEADLIIESVVEDPTAKIQALRRAESRAPMGTVLATNTSSLSLSELAANLGRPGDFAGCHWFNPPELINVVEVVPGSQTKEGTVRKLVAWLTAVEAQPVQISREIEGFVANRLQYALMREAYSLVEKGVCNIKDIDKILMSCLAPRWSGVGPYEAMDLAGLDVHHEVARRLLPTLANQTRPAAVLEQLLVEGALGTKSGRGLHGDYDTEAVERLVERRTEVLTAIANAKARIGPRVRLSSP